MSNLIIPAILAATVLVAGLFASMPIEKASTVHTALLAGASGLQRVTATDQADVANQFDGDVEITGTAPFLVMAVYICDVEIGNDAVADTLVIGDIEVDDNTLNTENLASLVDIGVADETPVPGCYDLLGFAGADAPSSDVNTTFGANAEFDMVLVETDADNDDDADGIDIIAYVLGGGTVSVNFSASD